MNGELNFSSDGKHPGLLYDKSDEYEAYERQNLFSKKVDSHTYVDEKYDTKITSYPISYKTLPQGQKGSIYKTKKRRSG